MKHVWGLALLTGLAGCGGGADDPADPFRGLASCYPIFGTVTTTDDPACGNCTITDAALAADGTLGRHAVISMDQFASGTGPAIRATASEHTPGGKAGAWIHIPQGAQGYTVTVRTLLAGAVQQTVTLPNTMPTGSPAIDTYVSVDTTRPFDAIEVQASDANFTAVDVSFKIYELCSVSDNE